MTDSTKNIRIGEVVYILSHKNQTIVPALVVEETTVNTLNGKKVTWKVAIGPEGPKRKVADSTNLNGELFSSLEDVESFLTTRLTKFINKAVGDAKRNGNAWYGKVAPPQPKPEPEKPVMTSEKVDPESFLSDFESENSSNSIFVSSEEESNFRHNMQQISEEEQQENLKRNLREKLLPSREELQADVKHEPEQVKIRTVTGPDGLKIPLDFKV